MKKVLSGSKLPTPSKFVRRVLSRSSITSKAFNEETKSNEETMKAKPASEALELELTCLRKQISELQLTISDMQEDAEKKEKALANLAREKQQLYVNLQKERRSTTNLQQQLEDERQFYYKEKEQYCQEMNQCKDLKRKLEYVYNKKEIHIKEQLPEVVACKSQIFKLKKMLQQTLETNYNLSVKFLRMKNTKTILKNRLKEQYHGHEQILQDVQMKINNIRNDIADVLDKKFSLPISPSNKKYLQVIKQNGNLMHENLCLQMEIDHLSAKVDHYKFICLCKESSKNLKSIYSRALLKNGKQVANLKRTKSKVKHRHKNENGYMKKIQLASEDKKQKIPTADIDVVKIYERSNAAGVPEIILLGENQEEKPTLLKKSSQIETNLSDATCSSFSRDTIRTQSAPEIVQTTLFISTHKP